MASVKIQKLTISTDPLPLTIQRAPIGVKPTVCIIGGGLAGLAAAAALASRGLQITILESRNRLGGRASSFNDSASGQMVDTCQHVSMGCCTNLAHFCRTVGINHLIERQTVLYFMTPDRRVSRFHADPLPAPFHLTRSFLRTHYLTWADKLRIAWGLACLRKEPEGDPSFSDWLASHRQTPQTVSRFWGVVLTSALNETPDRIGLRYARKVFWDGFLRQRRGFELEVPRVPLSRLYGEELNNWFSRHGVQIMLQHAALGLCVEQRRIHQLDLRQKPPVQADWYIAALPFDRLLDLLSPELINAYSSFSGLRNLETSPITSVHLWYDRPITSLPHVVLVDCLSQWVFNRGEIGAGEHYVQVVISAARQFRGMAGDEVRRRVVEEMGQLFPNAQTSHLSRARVVTEHAATFSAVPGVDAWRPSPETPLENLLLAGDYTATGWPATMEGAVRSGYLAAEALCRRLGTTQRFLQQDL